MRVEEIVRQADSLIGQSVDIQGELIVLQNADKFFTYLFSDEASYEDEPQQIAIAHSLPELKAIMQPLPNLQLLHQGELTHPPYFYRFPIQLTAVVALDAENQPILREITAVCFHAPYAKKLSEFMPSEHYVYQAQINYNDDSERLKQHEARAIIKSQRVLQFIEDGSKTLVLGADDNRYARRHINQKLRIPGWLRYMNDQEIKRHFLLRTFALRSSVTAVGILKDLTNIWWQPSAYYKVLRANTPIKRIEEVNLKVEITGKIDYLPSKDAPYIQGGTQPKLVFTEIDEIVIHEESYLR